MTLNPRLHEIFHALGRLRAHAFEAGLIIEDARGSRYAIARTFAIGTKTGDPGLVLRLVREPICRDEFQPLHEASSRPEDCATCSVGLPLQETYPGSGVYE